MNNKKTTAPVVMTMSEFLPEPIVDVVGGVTYKGYAPMNTGETEEGWRITRTTTSGTVTKVEYAQGTMEFISAWSKRTEYNYSR